MPGCDETEGTSIYILFILYFLKVVLCELWVGVLVKQELELETGPLDDLS